MCHSGADVTPGIARFLQGNGVELVQGVTIRAQTVQAICKG